jgi:DNA-binding phage protein
MSDDIEINDLPTWDAADYLSTPELQAEYLSVVMEEGDEAEVSAALEAIERARRAGGTGIGGAPGDTSETIEMGGGASSFGAVLKTIRSFGLTLSAQVRPVPPQGH